MENQDCRTKNHGPRRNAPTSDMRAGVLSEAIAWRAIRQPSRRSVSICSYSAAQYSNEDMQQQIIKETFQLVSKRDDNVCNFLEGGSLIGGSDYKLIYRHYATLYFVFCVDSSESELGILDLIQLDLIFHADAAHQVLDELVMGGMVLQTNMTDILSRLQEQNKMQKAEAGLSAAPARAVSAVKSINLPQQLRDMKLPDIPQAIKDLKF
ncbi:unnamed protein product [Leptidea sinapis]|uniref:AP complex mu/sigma subunit domain-containing protein n=1 Tax=Leptidea sinapis TaxID=189913 RepID=A0A5E4QRF4_9NEOP|nr:unnamed protein product [Leptidea sinapis]